MGVAKTSLDEKDRKKLDGIVQKMIANKEPEDNIRFVVDDFKSKYSVKKKELGAVASDLGSGLSSSDGLSGLPETPQMRQQNMKWEAVNNPQLKVTEEEFDADPVGVSNKIILSKAPKIRANEARSSSTFVKPVIQPGVEEEVSVEEKPELTFSDASKKMDEVRSYYANDTRTSLPHLMKITGINDANALYDDSLDERIKASLRPGNETDRLAYQRLQDAKKANKAISAGGDLEEMATNFAALQDPEEAKRIESLRSPTLEQVVSGNAFYPQTIQQTLSGEAPMPIQNKPSDVFDKATLGRFMFDALNNSAFAQELQRSPELAAKYRQEVPNLIRKYPEFGRMYLGNMISQKLEDMGMNNGVLNVVTKSERDKAVDELVREGKMDTSEKAFYEENIRPLSGLGLLRRKIIGKPVIDTPGALENTGEGAFTGLKNIPGGIYELTGLRKSILGEREALKEDLANRDKVVNIKPKGIAHEFTDSGGQFLGQSLAIGGGGGLIKTIKLAKDMKTAIALSGGIQAYANYAPQARMMFPGDEMKQRAYASLLSGIEMATENIFNDRKVIDGILGRVKPGVVETIKDFTAKNITAEAASKKVKELFSHALTSFGKGVSQNTAEEVAAQLGQQITDGVFQGKPLKDWIDGEDLWETARQSALGSGFIAALSTRADLQRSKGAISKNVYEMAQDPDYWINQIQETAKLDETLAAEAPDRIENLQFAGNVLKNLANSGLSDKQKQKFLISELEWKIRNENKGNIASQALRAKEEKELQENEKEREDILLGKDDGTIEWDKSDDLTPNEVKAIKLISKEPLPGMYGEIDPLDALKEISYQAQGLTITPEGETVQVEGGGRREDLQSMGVSDSVIDAAIKAFPNPTLEDQNRILEGGDITQEEEINQPIENEPTIIQENTETVEPVPTEEGQPSEATTDTAGSEAIPPAEESQVDRDGTIRLTYADTARIYQEYGLPERLTTKTKKNEELEAQAEKKIKEGYNFDEVANKVMKREYKMDDIDQVAFAKRVGALKAKQQNLDIKSDEFDKIQDEIEKLSRATDVAGEIGGRFLQSRKVSVPMDESISDYVMREKEESGVDELTERQKEVVQKEYQDIERLKKEWEEKYNQLVEKHKQELAESEFKKKKGGTKKQKKDFKAERDKIFESIRDKLKKARQDTSVTLVPYAKELFAIAPDVAKLMTSYIEQGVIEFAEVVRNIHEDLKEIIPEIQQKDVRDIISGEYNKPKKTQTQLAKTRRDLQDQAKLINKLENLLNGEEPKNEKAKVQRNREITKLREQIKDISGYENEVKKAEAEMISEKAKRNKATEKDLGKAEKELDAADEKERKRLFAEAEKERKQLEREFEKEKRAEEKSKLKAAVDEAKRIEKELSFRTPEERALDTFKTKSKRELTKIEEQLRTGDFEKKEGKPPLKLDAEAREIRDKLIKAKQERELRLMHLQYEQRNNWEKTRDALASVLNVPRVLMASMDFSAPLRQALIATISHPRTAVKAGLDMFKAAWSQKYYDRWFDNLQQTPRYELMKDTGLAISDPHSLSLSAKEEEFMSNLVDKVPFIGKAISVGKDKKVGGLVKGSERAYSMYLNKMRVDMFNQLADQMEKNGKSYESHQEQFEQMAKYVNNLTGRGDLGAFNNAAPLLSGLLFSPRLIASRLNMLTYLAQPRFYKTVPAEVRKSYFKDMTTTVLIGLGILQLAKAAGADVEDDPRSADFGKIKQGDTRWDIWGGFQQYARVAAQIQSGQRVSGENVYELDGEGQFGQDRGDVLVTMLRSKLSPAAGIAWDRIKGRDILGRKVTWDWLNDYDNKGKETVGLKNYIINHFVPLSATGTAEAMKDRGIKAMIDVGIPNIFGVGTQTYHSEKPKRRRKKQE